MLYHARRAHAKANFNVECPESAIEEIANAAGITPDKMLLQVIEVLGHECFERWQLGDDDPDDADGPDEPTLFERLIEKVEARQKELKEDLIIALDHEPVSEISSRKDAIKELDSLCKLLKGVLEWEKRESRGCCGDDLDDE